MVGDQPAGLGQRPQVPQGDINLAWSSGPEQSQWLEDREPLYCSDQGTAYFFQGRQWRLCSVDTLPCEPCLPVGVVWSQLFHS